jgi:hypothetical protein
MYDPGHPYSFTVIVYVVQGGKTGVRYDNLVGGALSFPQLEEFALFPVVISQVAYARLDDDGSVVEADDESAGVDDMVVLEDAQTGLTPHGFLEIWIGQ